MSKINEKYASSDLPLVTTLSLDFSIVSVDHSNPRTIIFHFANTTKLQARIKAYWQGTLRIEPQRYFLQLKHIKTLIYGGAHA